jgi:quercetin dioxygenase-like cupin family protein
MKSIKNRLSFFAFLTILMLIGCNESATTADKDDSDTTAVATKMDTSDMPAYDPALEPLTVGAKFTKKLADTLGIKMYEFTVKPGDSAALHAHPDHTVYVLQGGQLAVTFEGAGRQVMNLQTGTGFVSGPILDAGRNVGKTTVKLLVTDIYRPREK